MNDKEQQCNMVREGGVTFWCRDHKVKFSDYDAVVVDTPDGVFMRIRCPAGRWQESARRRKAERDKLAKDLFIAEAERDSAQYRAESNLSAAQGRIVVLGTLDRHRKALVEMKAEFTIADWKRVDRILEKHKIDPPLMMSNPSVPHRWVKAFDVDMERCQGCGLERYVPGLAPANVWPTPAQERLESSPCPGL